MEIISPSFKETVFSNMVAQQLLLSSKTSDRLLRHVLAWTAYILLFHLSNNNRTLLYIGCYIPSCILSVYVFSYLLLPTLVAKKYIRFTIGTIVVYIIILLIDYLASTYFFTHWEGGYFTTNMVFGLALFNQVNALCTGGIAMGLKMTKNWYLFQKENQSKERLKAKKEISLEKVNLYPSFILETLKHLKLKIEKEDKESPFLIMKMSNTLSYILYDSQDDTIELGKELAMMRDYIDLRKIIWPSTTFCLLIDGDPTDKQIAPLALFKLLQNLFDVIQKTGHKAEEIVLQINISGETLSLRSTTVLSGNSPSSKVWGNLINNLSMHLKQVVKAPFELGESRARCLYSISLYLELSKTRSLPTL